MTFVSTFLVLKKEHGNFKKYKQTLECEKVLAIRPDLMCLGLGINSAKGPLFLTFGSASMILALIVKRCIYQRKNMVVANKV